MMRHTLLPFAALAALTFAPTAQAASDQSSGPAMERMQNWAADHEAFLDAKLAGLKAGLQLTSDQDKLWPPFEAAVRDAAKLHMDQMKSMMERMRKMHQMMEGMKNSDDMNDEDMKAASPIDRLEAMGQRMTERGDAIKKVADAAKPLYASLDDAQKRRFALLGRALFMMGHGHHGMGMMHGRMGMMGGMMGEGGMGMMGGKPNRMESPGNGHDEEDDNSDEE